MSDLAILSEGGQQSSEDEVKAMNAILQQWPPAAGSTYAYTIRKGNDATARIDGFFIRGGVIRACAECKCRYKLREEQFWRDPTYDGKWLVTEEKLVNLAFFAARLRVPGFGILYLVESKVALVTRIVSAEGFFTQSHMVRSTQTPKTCACAAKKVEPCGFWDMRGAARIVVP